MDSTAWAMVGLVLFLALLAYMKVPGFVARTLDDRAQRIRNELDEARKLREEAQQLLAEYQRKRKEAEQEAEAIVAAANREAENIVVEARQKTEEFVERRNAMAEQKIAQAERDAVHQVRTSAVDIAVAAAERILADKVDAKMSAELFRKSMGEVKTGLN
ncbi:F0F1 ATP synthase subunit B [Chelativorans sp. ZYF759]|uniref:F0F1 ATP synthase subunit B n=1 Tax=Chelativorans sp. ZYF759 TaxID=2692213 RepID=UPI00145C661E|nr:F0F1 ATP synthase subunit B [Chelativorans sp. ZYF759]NMG41089.1 F0F1 ATP synthase subunit B [Chelativorans sp. ZYF759]